MGRDVTGIRNDMKPNEMNYDRVHVAPTIASDKVEPEQSLSTRDHNSKEAREEVKRNQEVQTMENTNNESGVSNGIRAKIEALKGKLSVDASPSLKPSPDANTSESIEKTTPKAQASQGYSGVSESLKIRTPKAQASQDYSGVSESLKIGTPKAQASQDDSGVSESLKISTPKAQPSEEESMKIRTPKAYSSPEDSAAPESIEISTPRAHSSQKVSTDKIASSMSNASEVEIDNSSTNSPMSKKNELHPKTPQSQSPRTSGKSLQSDTEDKLHDEEDSYSYTSSGDTSTRSASKFKPTVPVGPKFVCGERVARRKEYYKQLEEKKKAMEAERLAEQARIKEAEEAALKKLRRSMSYRANPVPNFYREGSPPKTKLKKLPLTRPKSPKLTRGRSSNSFKSARDEKKSAPNGKDRFGTKTASKNKVGVGEETDTTNTPSEEEQIDSNKHVVGEKNTSPRVEQSPMPSNNIVEDSTKA